MAKDKLYQGPNLEESNIPKTEVSDRNYTPNDQLAGFSGTNNTEGPKKHQMPQQVREGTWESDLGY